MTDLEKKVSDGLALIAKVQAEVDAAQAEIKAREVAFKAAQQSFQQTGNRLADEAYEGTLTSADLASGNVTAEQIGQIAAGKLRVTG